MMKLVAGLLLAVVFAGCTRPTDVAIPALSTRWDDELRPVLQKLHNEDSAALIRYLERARSGELFDSQGLQGVPTGTTVGQAIAAQRKYERQQLDSRRGARTELVDQVEPKSEPPITLPRQATQQVPDLAAVEPGLRDFARTFVDAYDKRDAEKLATAKCEADRPKLHSAVSVRLLGRRQLAPSVDGSRISFQYEQEFDLVIKNNTTKPLIGVAGTVEFVDVFSATIGTVELEVTETIQPNSEILTESKSAGRNPDRMWDTKDGKFKLRFVPETIVFESGQTLRRRC
jgi:hypothetical protein